MSYEDRGYEYQGQMGLSYSRLIEVAPHSYALGVMVETFRMPRNVTGIAMGKSTYARAGLLVNTTPLEAGWVGRLVVETR